jgi:hypothetical protein
VSSGPPRVVGRRERIAHLLEPAELVAHWTKLVEPPVDVTPNVG